MNLPLAILALAATAPPATLPSPEEIRTDVRALSSDAFAGRGPGEQGETATIAYLQRKFAEAGLEPGGEDGSWYQSVPLVRLDRQAGATAALSINGRSRSLDLARDVALTFTRSGQTSVVDAPLAFAGFGITDAATGHDDFAGMDWRGKIAVVFANDPDFEAGRDLGFEGARMTIAGRTGSKAAAAAKAGALGVLILHEEAAVSIPFWQYGAALPSFVPQGSSESPLAFSGFVDRATWLPLLAAARLDLAALKTRARKPEFRAIELPGMRISAAASVRATPIVTRNVIARLKGSARPTETILYGAHWDANGTNAPDARGDAIRNGAVDNAIGTAELLAVARAFARGPRPARSIVFAAWTAEEKGLLGAEHYAARPIYPLATTVAVINLDPHVALPRSRTVELIGGGRTTLERDLADAAGRHGLRVVAEPNPQAGWYFRSDHYAFAKRGVPAVSFRIGRDLVRGGTVAGDAAVARYNARCYHQPCDEFDARWDAVGAAQEASVAFTLGHQLATTSTWPKWRDPAFAAIRAPSDAERR